MFLAQTSGNFGESIQITGSGDQFFSISEVRVGGVSGVAAQFNVQDKNTISFVVPSFNSLTGSGDRNAWVNDCQPNPIIVIAEARNVSGFASGASGEEKNFSPIPVIDGFSPTSGVSGDTVVVEGDGFFGLTGLSIINISGSPNGYSDLTGLSNVVTGVGFPYDTGSGYADQVYLDFTITNNTGLSFSLPSGNFDGNIKVYGSGNVSAISDQRIEPHVEITGFSPAIGTSGSFVLISGRNFFDELVDITSGSFDGTTGTFDATGVLVAFNGDNATGCFTKINNILLSGLIPLTAKSGPIKIAKNINVLADSGEVPYYQSTGMFFLNVPAPEISGLKSVGGEESFFGFQSILETGDYNFGTNSGISLTGSSVADWKTGTAIFSPSIISAGLYDQTISGENEIEGPLFDTPVEFIEENFIPMADGGSLKSSLLTFQGNNFFESGVTGDVLSGSSSPPITIFAPVMGPEIDECLDHFNRGGGFLSGCEQAYLLHFSGHYKFFDLDSPDFQPGLLQCFMTDQSAERATAGITGATTGTAITFVQTGESGIVLTITGENTYDNVEPDAMYAAGALVQFDDFGSQPTRCYECRPANPTGQCTGAAFFGVIEDSGNIGGFVEISCFSDQETIISLGLPTTGTEEPISLETIVSDFSAPNFDPYATELGATTGTNAPPAGAGPSIQSVLPPKVTSRISPNSLNVNTYGQVAFTSNMSGTCGYTPQQGPVYTSKANTDPFEVTTYSNPNNNIYPNNAFRRPTYSIPKIVQENPTSTNWTAITLFKNGRQPTNLAGTLTPSQLNNYTNNPNQVPGFNRIFFTNNLNSKGNKNINLRPQSRGTNIVGGVLGTVGKTLNKNVNPRRNTGSQRKGVLKVSPPPSSVHAGYPGLYKPNVPQSNEILPVNPPHVSQGGIGNSPGIPGLNKLSKETTLGGGNQIGEENTPWKRTREGGGGKAGSNQTNPPILITCTIQGLIGTGITGTSSGFNIPTSQKQNTNIGVCGVGGGQKPTTTVSPVKPNGPVVCLGPLTPPPNITRTITQNFPSSPPPQLFPPPQAPTSPPSLPPLHLYPRVSPTQTEGMTNVCASPCTPAHTGNTGWGIGILADPEIEECAINNCFQHCLKTGSTGYSYYEPVAQSKFVIKNSVRVPYHVSNIVRTGMLYCSGDFPDTAGVFIENSGVGVFEGGFITTEASRELDLSTEDKWAIQFWAKFENHYANIQNEPYSGIDVNLFGLSGEHTAESGNTFFNVGFSRELVNEITGARTGDTNFDDVRLLLRVTGDGFDASERNLTGINVGASYSSTFYSSSFTGVPSYIFDGNDYIQIQGIENGNASKTYPHIWDLVRQSDDLGITPQKPAVEEDQLTIEFFMKMPTMQSSTFQTILSAKNFRVINFSGVGLTVVTDNMFGVGHAMVSIPDGSGVIGRVDDDAWHHVAYVKSGANYKMWVDGILSGRDYTRTTHPNSYRIGSLSPNDELYIGKDAGGFITGINVQGNTGYSGLLQELRISDVARYVGTGNITVPTSPYPTGLAKKAQYSITNTVKPYADLLGIQSSTNYYTGWFADDDWHHFAFVRNQTGYATYYDGYQVGKNVPVADYDCFIPSGRTKFSFGGLTTGRFGKFNTGFNQQFISGSDTDLLLHFNGDLLDSGKYNQTISSGGFPTFTTGVNDKYFGSAAIYFDGSDYLQTSGQHFAYGTGDFTIECWIKPSGATSGISETGNGIQTVWALANQYGEFSTGNGLALMLNHYTNNLRLAFDSEIEELQVDLIPPLFGNYFKSGEWNHVAITRENNIFYGFVNGDPAGGFGGEDFAEHEATKLFFTGNPSLTDSTQNLFIGGAVSGDLNMFFVDTGELFDTQPYKLDRDQKGTDEHYTIVNSDGSCSSRRYIGKNSTLNNTGNGFTYIAKTDGTIEITLQTLSRWGGACMSSLGVEHSYAGVRFEHNGQALEADGTPSDVGIGENTIRWPLGGWKSTLQNSNTRFVYGVLANSDRFLDGANDFTGAFVTNCDNPRNISMRGCELKKTINQIITGVSVGDEIKLIANRYFNEGGPTDNSVTASNGKVISNTIDDLYKRNTMGEGEEPLASGPDILHIESMLIRENILTNYVGLIDEFRISSGVKYTNTPDTGSFATGYLNTDLGGKVYVDELNIRKDSLIPNMGDGNGIEEVPTGAPATGYNFEVVLDSGNLIVNGTTGDNESQPLRTFLTDVSTSGGAMVTFSENGNAKYGNRSMSFPTGLTTTGSQNFLYKSGINFGTGDFLAQMWIKPSGFTYLPNTFSEDLALESSLDFHPMFWQEGGVPRATPFFPLGETTTGIDANGRFFSVRHKPRHYAKFGTSGPIIRLAENSEFPPFTAGSDIEHAFPKAGINGAFVFKNSGVATGEASFLTISGNKITGGDMFPSLSYPFVPINTGDGDRQYTTTTGNWGDFGSGCFSIEFLFKSDETIPNQKIFEWGDLGFVINDAFDVNPENEYINYFFWDGSGHKDSRIEYGGRFSDGRYHTVQIVRNIEKINEPGSLNHEKYQDRFTFFVDGGNLGGPATVPLGPVSDSPRTFDFGNSPLRIAPPYSGQITEFPLNPFAAAKFGRLSRSKVSGVCADFNLAKFRVWKGINILGFKRDGGFAIDPNRIPILGDGNVNGHIDTPLNSEGNHAQPLKSEFNSNSVGYFLGGQYRTWNAGDGTVVPTRNTIRANPVSNSYMCILDIQPEASINGEKSKHIDSNQLTQFKDSSSNDLLLKNYNVNRYSGFADQAEQISAAKFGNNSMWFAGMFDRNWFDPFYSPNIKIKEGNFDFGTAGDFTIECWLLESNNYDFNIFGSRIQQPIESGPSSQTVSGKYYEDMGWGFVLRNADRGIFWYDSGSGLDNYQGISNINKNDNLQWNEEKADGKSHNHLACVRHSGILTIFVNGIAVHSHRNTFDVNDLLNGTSIGSFYTNTDEVSHFYGRGNKFGNLTLNNTEGFFVDQIRVSNTGRYTYANQTGLSVVDGSTITGQFTVPTGEFVNDGTTNLLIDADAELSGVAKQRIFDRSIVPSPSGFTNSATVIVENTGNLVSKIENFTTKQTLLTLGDYDRGFNFFLTGNKYDNTNNLLGLDISNGAAKTGTDYNTENDVRCQLFDKQGAAQYWTSGDWNHIAVARINNNFQAYVNGYSAGKLNVFNTYFPSGQADDEGNNIGLTQVITGFDENGIELFATGGAIDEECVNQLHFGIPGANYYVTGIYSGIGIDLETGRAVGEDSTDISGHYVSGLDVSGRLVLGGGSQDAYNFQGEIDAFSFKTGTINEFTGLKMHNPEPFIECDEQNELVCHFDRVSGSIDFDDEHCCITGVNNGEWGEIVGIKGSGFFNITGVLFGENRQPSIDFFVPERNYISAEIPDGASSGPTVIVGSGLGADSAFEITGCHLEINPPLITIFDANFPISGQPNEVITISGRGLNQLTNLSIFDSLNRAIYLPLSGTNVGNQITFSIPNQFQISGTGQVFESRQLPLISDVRFSGITGFYGNSPDIHSFTTGDLFVLKSGIEAISPASGIHNEEISLSGRFYSGENGGVDVPIFPLFQTGLAINEDGYSQLHYTHGINTKYIKSTVGSTNGMITGITTQVPRDIVRGALGISGSGITVPNIISEQIFTPIPTISGIEITNLKVGSAFRMTGVNACYIKPVIGFTGINLQPAYGFSGTSSQGALTLIANTGNIDAYNSGTYYENYDPITPFELNTFGDGLTGYNDLYYFGNMFIDKTQLTTNWPESAQTGFVIITGTLNATTVGTGNPFLISSDELRDATGVYSSADYEGFDDASDYENGILRNETDFVYATKNINKVTGDQIIISGRVPQLSGLRPVIGSTGTLIEITGTNLLNITGMFFSGGGQVCEIGTGAFDTNVVFETGFDPLTNFLTTTPISTGYYLGNYYQGTGEYIDRGDWINIFRVQPSECVNLLNLGNTTVDVLFNTGILTTGDIE